MTTLYKKKLTLKNTCFSSISKLISSGELLLPSLQILGYDILEQLLHYIHGERKLTSDDLILSLINPNLHTLNLSLCNHLQDNAFESILKECPLLRGINISGCIKITNDGIKMIGKYCNDLETLSVANNHTITSDSIQYVLNNCPNAHSFNFADCWALDDNVMIQLGMIRHQLRYVNICGCRLLSHKGVSAMLGNDLNQPTQPNCNKTCPSLLSFHLSICKPTITTPSVLEIAMAAPNLTSLNIGSIKTVSDQAFLALAANCSNLRELLACWCPVTDGALAVLAEKCTDLELLNLSGCNRVADGTCTALAQHSHKLKKLNLSSTKITFNGLSKIINNSPLLQSLDVRGCKFTLDQKEQCKAFSFHVKF